MMMMSRAPAQRRATVSSRKTAPSQRSATVGSRHTAPPGLPAPAPAPAPKRVCFYKSGDPRFSGVRAVVSGRTFKSFDALLDVLSKKVPLPFGVRTVTTPRGTRPVLSLEELEDGQSYLCSDRRRVKPIDLEAARRRPPPWSSALPSSRGRRAARPAGGGGGGAWLRGSAAVRPAPQALTVFRNGDPGTCHTVALQGAELQGAEPAAFHAILAHISELLHLPRVKLFSPDGRKVDSLPALLLCSAVVASTDHEPFRPHSYGPHRAPRPAPLTTRRHQGPAPPPQPRPRKSNSQSRKNSGDSPSFETLLADQINDSASGDLVKPHTGSTVDTAVDAGGVPCAMDMAGLACVGDRGGSGSESEALLPPDVEDIEKSCRINQDGSMTVEMKVRLMIKEEETVHWTTTLTRSSTTCWPGEGTTRQEPKDERSPDSDCPIGDPDDDRGRGRTNVELPLSVAGAGDPREEGEDGDGKTPRIRRVQTPGPRVSRKRLPSPESSPSDSEARDSHTGQRTSASTAASARGPAHPHSRRPAPKRRSAAAANRRELHTAFRASRSAEVLRIRDGGSEVTQSVLRVYELQSCFDRYICSAGGRQSVSRELRCRTFSTGAAPHSPGNDNNNNGRLCITSEAPCCGESDCAPTSPESAAASHRIRDGLSSFTDNEARVAMETPPEGSARDTNGSESRGPGRGEAKSSENLKVRKKKSLPLSPLPDRSLGEECLRADLGGVRHVKSASDVARDGKADGVRANGGAEHEKGQLRKMRKKNKGKRDGGDLSKCSTLLVNYKYLGESEKKLNLTEGQSIAKTKLNLNTFAKNNLLDIQPSLLVRKMLLKQWSMNEEGKGARETGEMSESVSMPVLLSSPSAVSEHVGNWLEKMTAHDVTSCAEDASGSDMEEERVRFRIGCDSVEQSEAESERRSAAEERSTSERVADGLSSHPPGPEQYLQDQNMRKNTGVSKSDTCLKTTAGGPKAKMHKSTEALTWSGTEMPSAFEDNQEPEIKPLVEQLCSSIQTINQISQSGHTHCLETSQSLPDFSSLVTSIFGSSSKMLIAFLSVLALKEAISSLGRGRSPVRDSGVSEALQMVKALHKLASLEDVDELQTGLSDLHKSASTELLGGWRSFQELGSLSDGQEDVGSSEHPTPSEESGHQEGYPYGFQELMKELDISGDLQRGLSGLVMGEMMNNVKRDEAPMEKSEEASSVFESGTTEDDLTESQQGTGDSDFAQSTSEDEVTDSVPSLAEEDHDFTQPDLEEQINSPEESIFEEGSDDSVQEKETDKLEESVPVQEDDSQHTLGETMNDHASFFQGNRNNGSVSEEHERTEDDVSQNYALSISADADIDKCKHSTLEEADYLEERGRDTGESAISIGQETESSHRQMEDCFSQMGVGSEAFELSSAGRSRKGESVAGDSEDRVAIAKLQTGSGEPGEPGDPDSAAVSHSVQIPEDLLEYVRSVLMSSSLVFGYDSRGRARVEPERPGVGPAEGVPQYPQKRLRSPCMSDLSDYRDTSESDGCSSRPSVELTSESEGEGSAVQPIAGEFTDGCSSRPSVELTSESEGEGSAVLPIAGEFTDGCSSRPSVELTSESEGEGSAVQPIAGEFTDGCSSRPSVELTSESEGKGSAVQPIAGEFTDGCSSRPSVELTSESEGEGSAVQPIAGEFTDGCSSRPSVELTSESEGEGSAVQPIAGEFVDGSEGEYDPNCEEEEVEENQVEESQASGHSSHHPDERTEETGGAPPDPSPKRAAPCTDDDLEDGVLIDKGRWLLKENHLIRKSPPVPSGMYGNVETTSADTTQDDASEVVPFCAPPGNHRSPMAVLSSAELEELSAPPMPKCSYFNMSHGSDSEPFQEDEPAGGNEKAARTEKEAGASPSDEHRQTRAKRCDSPSAFTSVEFKENRVRPQAGPVVHPQAESLVLGPVERQDSQENLQLVCCRLCTIL